MKNIFLFTIYILFHTMTFAQGPVKFHYQAVARDQSGTVLTGNINLRLSLLEDSANGTNKCTETYDVTTNPQGVINLNIGEGTPISGDINLIDWSAHQYWLKVEIKTPVENNFTEMGTTQLLSVPYALYATKAGNELSAGQGITIVNNKINNTGDLSDNNELQTLSVNGNQLSISNGNTVTMPTGTTYNEGSGINISGNTISAVDASTTNELQTLSVNGTQLAISNGNIVTLPTGTTYTEGAGIDINGNTISANDNSPMNELQSLSLNGNQLAITNGNSVTLPTGITYTEGAGIDINGNTISANDNSPTNEIQTLSLNGLQLSLSNGGGSVQLPEGSSSGWTVNGNETSNMPLSSNVLIGSVNGAGSKLSVASSGSNNAGNFFAPGSGDALHAYNNGSGAGINATSLNGIGAYFSSEHNYGLLVEKGNVGIGITSPVYKLDVNNGTFRVNGSENPQASTIIAYSHHGYNTISAIGYDNSDVAHFLAYSGTPLELTNSGNGGLGTGLKISTDIANWNIYNDVAKDINFAYEGTLKAWIYDTDGSYHNSSDSRLKKDIHPFKDVLSGLTKLQAYTYHMKDAPDDSPVSVGFMAQDVEKQFPELVVEKNGYKSLCYDHFAVMSVQAIKEQQVEIEDLKTTITNMDARMKSLEERLARLEK